MFKWRWGRDRHRTFSDVPVKNGEIRGTVLIVTAAWNTHASTTDQDHSLQPGRDCLFPTFVCRKLHLPKSRNSVAMLVQGAAFGWRIGKPVEVRHCPRNGNGVERVRQRPLEWRSSGKVSHLGLMASARVRKPASHKRQTAGGGAGAVSGQPLRRCVPMAIRSCLLPKNAAGRGRRAR